MSAADEPKISSGEKESRQALEARAEPLGVLVVDDDREVASMLQVLLSAAGYRVVCARSMLMAREALAEEFFPIVILDRGLEDGDGLRLCGEIRELSVRGYVYIVLLTARDSRDDVVAGLRAGADDYLSKKTSESELLARLNTASRIVRLEQSLRAALNERAIPASTDTLTGGHNRRHFVKQVGRDLQQAVQTGQPLSILILDIDFFKTVNDRHGHVTGDELLRQLANRIRFALPNDRDWIARIGGEEFVVVLPRIDVRSAVVVAERLRAAVQSTPFHVASFDLDITVSIGVASLGTLEPNEEPSAQALLDQADQYLYRSKLAGRDRVSAPQARLE